MEKKVKFYDSSVFHFYVRVLYFIAIVFGLSFIYLGMQTQTALINKF